MSEPTVPAGCAASYPDGGLCSRPSLPDAPFPICVKHAAKVLAFLRESAIEGAILTDGDRAAAAEVAANRVAAAKLNPAIVYYLRVGDLIKIGHTADLARRLREYPPSAVVLGVESGGRDVELIRLREFERFRALRHEWFHPSDELITHIQRLPCIAEWQAAPDADMAIAALRASDFYGGLMTAGEAARYAGVDWETIRKWIRHGHLAVAARGDGGRSLFRHADVVRAKKGRTAARVA